MSEILDKARRAQIAYLTAGNVGTANIYDAKRSGDKDAPLVGCDAMNAREDPPGTGNFWVDLETTVKASAAVDVDAVDPKIAADLLTANVMALFQIDNDSLKAALSSQISGFTVMGFGEEQEIEQTVEGDMWVTTWRRRAYCGGF